MPKVSGSNPGQGRELMLELGSMQLKITRDDMGKMIMNSKHPTGLEL